MLPSQTSDFSGEPTIGFFYSKNLEALRKTRMGWKKIYAGRHFYQRPLLNWDINLLNIF